MKKSFAILFLILALPIWQKCFADNIVPQSNIIKTNSGLYDFSKSYKTSSENLLYLLLAAINEHNYLIEEIQFKTGSVLFKASAKEFIASISAKDGYNSFIKIVPIDNSYNFSPSIIQKLHTYIEANNTAKFQNMI